MKSTLLYIIVFFGLVLSDNRDCPDGMIADCNFNCCPIEWLGDGIPDCEGSNCDFSCYEEEFECGELQDPVDYNSQIQPIFDNNCGNCHLGNSSGGLNLSSYENLMSNDVIYPGSHEYSELYDRITRDNADTGDMPPGNAQLDQFEIDLISSWINQGALYSSMPMCEDVSACNYLEEGDKCYLCCW